MSVKKKDRWISQRWHRETETHVMEVEDLRVSGSYCTFRWTIRVLRSFRGRSPSSEIKCWGWADTEKKAKLEARRASERMKR